MSRQGEAKASSLGLTLVVSISMYKNYPWKQVVCCMFDYSKMQPFLCYKLYWFFREIATKDNIQY